ncbi:glycosyltransferase family 2 protein [Dysgonomonas sp. HDW5A]|uniref:glycosyltransferase family 2 protein n=1 Tax=Dysgonomonas sp. HDW5A TaxID=2714926 RepID=UPI001408D369|nr:glycosyltransferase [Dysgonomonas sp. HDW5A]QIK58991.1 glycosyltransferase family 2 protein [Dysgonomonas sp. HDW5A]
MISICIPIYNNDVTTLVTDLYLQCEALDCLYEIILIDDASRSHFQKINRKLAEFDNISYEELPINISRSAIRNLFPHKAAYPYLLFIDNDALLCSPHFISTYLRLRSPGVICYGGCKYLPCYSPEYYLRWLYGVEREAISIKERQQDSDKFFSTFNFMIDKRVLLLHPFNEDLQEYGYEDVMFHSTIIEQGFHITQVDNPLIHTGLISNEEFLERTRISIQNLYSLQQSKTSNNSDLSNTVKLLQTKNLIDKLKLTYIISILFRLMKNRFIKNLLGKKPSLFILDLYKLGYLCNYSK